MNLAAPDGWRDAPTWAAATVEFERLLARWRLGFVAQLPGATCSLVARCSDRLGQEFVVKVPLAEDERQSGTPCAVAHSGIGGIEVLEHDSASGGFLMPLAHGPTLDQARMSDEEHLRVQADVSRRLQAAPWAEVWGMDRWFESLMEADMDKVPVAPENIERAQDLFRRLEATTTRRTLVHGDLHHFNIIRHNGEWVAVDPKGMWCDPAVEPGAFLRNMVDRLPSGDEMFALTRRRLELFTRELGEPWDRVWGWGFVVAVISVLWASEDFLPPWTELVVALERLDPGT